MRPTLTAPLFDIVAYQRVEDKITASNAKIEQIKEVLAK